MRPRTAPAPATRTTSPRARDPRVGRRDQHAEAAVDAPQRHCLLVAVELGRDVARDVADLQRPRLVPDRDRVRVVLVLGLAEQGEAAARVERRVGQGIGPIRDTRDRHDAHARVGPANGLAGSRVAQEVAGLAALEPDAKALAHRNASARRTACTPSDSLTTCVTRRSTTTLARASASSREMPCSYCRSSSIPLIAIRATRPRSSSKPNVIQSSRVRARGQSTGSLRTANVSSAWAGHSIAVPDTSPALWASCPSSAEESAPSTEIGRASTDPATSSLQSMLPPQRRGGIVEWIPGSGGGIPSTPRNGRTVTVNRSDRAVRLDNSQRTWCDGPV